MKLKPEHAARLKAMAEQEEALQRFIEQITGQGQRRAEELIRARNAFWQEIEKDYALDLKHVSYAPTPDFSELKAVMQRFD